VLSSAVDDVTLHQLYELVSESTCLHSLCEHVLMFHWQSYQHLQLAAAESKLKALMAQLDKKAEKLEQQAALFEKIRYHCSELQHRIMSSYHDDTHRLLIAAL
jgi:hypothetical protein